MNLHQPTRRHLEPEVRHRENSDDRHASRDQGPEISRDDAAYAGQILDGAKNIARYLIYLGFSEMTEKKVFHWAADGRLPIKKIGNRLVANKRAILEHLNLYR